MLLLGRLLVVLLFEDGARAALNRASELLGGQLARRLLPFAHDCLYVWISWVERLERVLDIDGRILQQGVLVALHTGQVVVCEVERLSHCVLLPTRLVLQVLGDACGYHLLRGLALHSALKINKLSADHDHWIQATRLSHLESVSPGIARAWS